MLPNNIQSARSFKSQFQIEVASMRFFSILLFIILSTSTTVVYAQSNNQRYEELVAQADTYFESKDYINAKAAYQYALRMRPEEEYPQKQLEKTVDILRKRFEKSSQYTQYINEAEASLEEGDVDQAIEYYRMAEEVLPGETYPAEKIDELQSALKEQQQREQAYGEALKAGEKYYQENNMQAALQHYRIADSLRPGVNQTRERITELESYLYEEAQKENNFNIALNNAEYFYSRKEYRAAYAELETALALFPENEEAKKRLEELKTLIIRQEKYDSLIAEADDLYIVKDFSGSKRKYEEAVELRPKDPYATEMISRLEKSIGEKNISEEKQYENAIAAGDQYLKDKNYSMAEKQFGFALRLKPGQEYPQEKLEIVAKVEDDYRALVANADSLFEKEVYQKAETKYQEALALFPERSYPSERLSQLDEIKQKIARKKANEEEYRMLIDQADQYLRDGNFQHAIAQYRKARNIRPNDAYPVEQLDKIDEILADQAAWKARQDAYDSLTEKASIFLEQKLYDTAKKYYQEALLIMPDDRYVREQIIETDSMKVRAIRKIEREAERKQIYEVSIKEADGHFANEEYELARAAYQKAVEQDIDEGYARQKLQETNAIFEEKQRETNQAFEEAIAEADRYYQSKAYDKAISFYKQAQQLKPEETYPSEMIGQIKQTIEDNLLAEVNSEEVVIEANADHKFNFDPIPVRERKDNYIIFTATNLSGEDLKVFLNYGKDQAKNGGLLFMVPAGEESQEMTIRVGTQYKWFSEDNNWISFYPQGGKMKVSTIRITKSE